MPIKTHKSIPLAPSSTVFKALLFILVALFPLSVLGSSDPSFLENGNPLNIGSDVGFILDTPRRLKIDLSGQWAYEVDGGESGAVQIPAAFDFIGKVTFSRTFDVTADQIDRYGFHFVAYGVNYACDVFLNGDFLMSHEGGYTSFVQPIPPNVLQPGTENQIRVIVRNQLDDRNTIPSRFQVWGWRNYGGILRDIFLLATPKVYVSDVTVRTSVREENQKTGVLAKVSVEARIIGEPEAVSTDPSRTSAFGFSVEMLDKISGFSVGRSPVQPLVRSPEGWANPRVDLVVQNPKLWSPEYPELYVIKAFLVMIDGKTTTVVDEMDVHHGIRRVEIERGDIHLNGQRLVLKGVIWNEDHPAWGSSLPYEQMEKDIVLIKSLGANAVRFRGHPPHPYMLNLCDRYGLAAFVELPVTYAPSSILQNDEYTEVAGMMLRDMILRDRTHPSVFAWGIGDGFESSSEQAREYVAAMVERVRELDDRPVYFASQMPEYDACMDLVDLAFVTISAKDLKLFRQQLEKWKSDHPNQPVVLAKFGTEVEHDNRNGYSDPLSYEAQARFFIQRFDVLKSVNYDGSFVWALNDWRGDRPALTINTGDPWMHRMGLVSDRREKRLAYDAVRAVFRGEKFVALPSGSYSATAPIVYVLSGLVLLVGSAYLYNADRRFRESLNRSLLNSYNFFADIRDQRVVSITHSSLLGIIVSVALAIVASTILYHFRDSWILDVALSYLLTTDHLKEVIIELILNPLQFILCFTLIFFTLMLLVFAIIYATSPFLKSRLYAYHSYSLTMWATPPLLVFVPVGMILFRVMESDVYVVPSLVLVGILITWVLMRLYKGVAIVADVYPLKVYFMGISSLVGIFALGYFYLDYTHSASEYLSFLYDVVRNSH